MFLSLSLRLDQLVHCIMQCRIAVKKVSSGTRRPGPMLGSIQHEPRATYPLPPPTLNFLICEVVAVLVPTSEVMVRSGIVAHEWMWALMRRRHGDPRKQVCRSKSIPDRKINGVPHPPPFSEEKKANLVVLRSKTSLYPSMAQVNSPQLVSWTSEKITMASLCLKKLTGWY